MPIHPLWIVALIVIVLIVFGPGKLPELGGAIGKGLREFRKATSELTNEVTKASTTDDTTARPQPPSPPPAQEPPRAETPPTKS